MSGLPYHFIVNTLARAYTPERANRVVGSLEARGIALKVHTVSEPGGATACASRICGEDERPVIIVGGGDGTINGVINGLPYGRATVAVVPMGTANVLAAEIGIRSIDDALERILAGEARFPAVGLLQTDKRRQYFLLMAGVGLDGFICEDVRATEKSILGAGAYLLAAIRRFAAWELGRLEIYAEEMRIDCHSLVVCNVARYGGNVVLAPHANLFTPEFEVLCVKDDRRRSYLRLVFNTIIGKYHDTADVRRFITGKLVVTGTKAIQADGDYFSCSPVRISCVEQLFRLLV